jgi:preprotein translocase subunit SecA
MGPDGKEISLPARVHPQSIVFSGGSATAADPGPAALPGSVGGNNGAGLNGGSSNGVASSIPVPTRAPSTTIDSLEEEFQRRKKRELQQARMAGAGEATETAQRRTGDKVGRNDPCPCGSGKKFKKCHGVDA